MATTRKRNVKSKEKGHEEVAQSKSSVSPVSDNIRKGPYTSYANQFGILLALALPWLLLLSVPLSTFGDYRTSPYTVQEIIADLKQRLQISSLTKLSYLEDRKFWMCVAALSTPHVFYFIVWTNANIFYSFAKKWLSVFGEPYEVFARLAHIIKLWQTIAIVVWYSTYPWFMSSSVSDKSGAFSLLVQSMSLSQLILGLELFFLGQLFNVGVYSAIGEDGVYYGCRLGRNVPWVFDFPFNTVPHPQYLGSTISIWGGYVLFATEQQVQNGLFGITLAITIFYMFSSYVEEHL